MSMWSSKTKMWSAKTRPVVNVPIKNGHDKDEDLEDDYEGNLEKYKEIAFIQVGEIEKLKETLKDRECEIKRLLVKLDENSSFLQRVVMELIALKTIPAPTMLPARTAMENYLAKKNSEEKLASVGPKGKLP